MGDPAGMGAGGKRGGSGAGDQRLEQQPERIRIEIAQRTGAQAIRAFAPQGIILSGGPESVTAKRTPRIPDVVFSLGVPVLGICYGMQYVAKVFGGAIWLPTARRGVYGGAHAAVVG